MIEAYLYFFFFFFKQKTAYEITRWTGVQTCALPILDQPLRSCREHRDEFCSRHIFARRCAARLRRQFVRSEERRVGKECRCRGAQGHDRKKNGTRARKDRVDGLLGKRMRQDQQVWRM